jgi:hypothetical protein
MRSQQQKGGTVKLNFEILRAALIAYQERQGHGAWRELQRMTGVHSSSIAKFAKGETKPQLESWSRLHAGAPHIIPAPVLEGSPSPPQVSADPLPGGLVQVPVFPCGAGSDRYWTDGGHPVGTSDEYIALPVSMVGPNTFAVHIHGESMLPTLAPDDLAVVDPSQEPIHGEIVFVTWPDDNGGRVARRFFRYGDTIVLRPDNPDREQYPEETLTARNGRGVRIFPITHCVKKMRKR